MEETGVPRENHRPLCSTQYVCGSFGGVSFKLIVGASGYIKDIRYLVQMRDFMS